MRKQRIFSYDVGAAMTKIIDKTVDKRSYPMLSTVPLVSSNSSMNSSPKDVSCIICLQSQRDYAFVPCGHLCICKDCAISVANLDDRCPICRSNATHVMRIFK